MPADHMYDAGILNVTSCPCMPKGRSLANATPPGLSALPFDTVTIGWNGGLPPSSVESFSGMRLWKMPPLPRTTVSGLIA